SHRVEAVNIERVKLIQGLMKAVLRLPGRFHGCGERQDRAAVGASGPLGESVGGQMILLSFETMVAQGAHDRSNVGKHPTGLVIRPDLDCFLPLLGPVAIAFHSAFPPPADARNRPWKEL